METKINRCIDKTVSVIDIFQKKRGLITTSALVALIFVVLAMVYVRPSFPYFPSNLVGSTEGLLYLSENPFNPRDGVGFRSVRIGVPLLSWALGLRGELMVYTTVGIIYGFLCSTFYYYSHKNEDVLGALAITSAFAFSHPILFNIYDLGSPDGARVFLAIFMI